MQDEGTKVVQIRVGAANYRWLKEEAAKQDRSMNWLMNRLVGDAAAQAKQQSQGAQS